MTLYLSDTCQCIAQHMNKVWLIWPSKEKTIHHFILGDIACYGLVLHTQSYGVYTMQEIMYKHVGIYVLLDAICDCKWRWDIPTKFPFLIPVLDTTYHFSYILFFYKRLWVKHKVWSKYKIPYLNQLGDSKKIRPKKIKVWIFCNKLYLYEFFVKIRLET